MGAGCSAGPAGYDRSECAGVGHLGQGSACQPRGDKGPCRHFRSALSAAGSEIMPASSPTCFCTSLITAHASLGIRLMDKLVPAEKRKTMCARVLFKQIHSTIYFIGFFPLNVNTTSHSISLETACAHRITGSECVALVCEST